MATPLHPATIKLSRAVLCTVTNMTSCIAIPEAKTSGKVSAGWMLARKSNILDAVSLRIPLQSRQTHRGLNVTCSKETLRASWSICKTINRAKPRLKAPRVTCIVRRVCTWARRRLSINIRVRFDCDQEASRVLRVVLRVMLRCARATMEGLHLSIL